ncbi:MAG TPA: hypothetical protein VK959_11945 [Methylophilaceae bacterium]|nr:hypothetical protein [Methylophilaceae bacterium]
MIDFTPPADLSPLHISSNEFFTEPSPKSSGRADADKFTILVVLVVVVLAIIGVIAGGVYLYLHDTPPPPPVPKHLSQTHQPNRIIDDPPVEEINMAGPPLLVSEPRTESPDALTTVSQAAVPDTPAPKKASKPKSKPKSRQPSAAPDQAADAVARAPPVQDESPPPSLAEKADTQPEASTDSTPEASYPATFNLALGVIVETRKYPSKEMKQRAMKLWAAEKKILEPDGSINDKYVLRKSDFTPIPGH